LRTDPTARGTAAGSRQVTGAIQLHCAG